MVTGLIIGALVGGVLLATMFPKKPNTTNMSSNALDDFSTTTCDEGSVVKLVRGRRKVVGNMLWYGNLKTVEQKQSAGGKGGGGGETTTGYKYYMDIQQGICLGPNVTIEALYESSEEVDNEGYTLNPGDTAYAPSEPGEYSVPMNPLAHVFFKQRYIGENVSTVPTYHYLVNVESSAPLTYANLTYGVNPSALILDYITIAGGSISDVVLSSFQTAADYWYNKGYGLNVNHDSQKSVEELIRAVFDIVDGNIRHNNEGLIELIAWTEDDTAVAYLDEDDFKSFSFQRRSWDDVYTDFRGNFIDRTLNYTQRTIRMRNTAAAKVAGQDNPLSVDLTAFIDSDIATKRLTEIMKSLSYPEATIKCVVPLKFHYAHEGDIVSISHDKFELSNADFRIISRQLSENDSNDIQWELTQNLHSLFDDSYTAGSSPAWSEVDYSPQAPYATKVFELPYNTKTGQDPAYLILVARKGVETSFSYYVSTTGTDYEYKGVSSTFAQVGNLAEDYPADTFAIDDEVGLLYTPVKDDPEFSSLSRSGLFTSTRIAIVGSEVMAFQTLTPIGSENKLTGVIRGLMNTTISSHTTGDQIWVADVGTNVLTGVSDTSFYVKATPQFGSSAVSLASVTAAGASYTAKAKYPWGVNSVGAERSGSTVTITINNTTQAFTGAGALSADSQPGVLDRTIEGIVQYYTNISGSPHGTASSPSELSGSLEDITISEVGAFNFYTRQILNGYASPWTTCTVGSTDGYYRYGGDDITSLEKVKYGCQGWGYVMNRNTVRLDEELLKLSNLIDVNDDTIADSEYLIWDASTETFVPGTKTAFTTTTTTTTV